MGQERRGRIGQPTSFARDQRAPGVCLTGRLVFSSRLMGRSLNLLSLVREMTDGGRRSG